MSVDNSRTSPRSIFSLNGTEGPRGRYVDYTSTVIERFSTLAKVRITFHVEPRFAAGHKGQLHLPIQTLPSIPPFFLPEIFVDDEEETVDLCVACGVFASEDEFGGANTGGVYSVAERFWGRSGTGESSV